MKSKKRFKEEMKNMQNIPFNLFYKFHKFITIGKISATSWRGETENEEVVVIKLLKKDDEIGLCMGIGFNEIRAENNLIEVAKVKKSSKPIHEITLQEINNALDLRWKNVDAF